MSESETNHCRLCAEPTKESNLISPDEDVAVNSKIVTKMLWINIDVSVSSNLPNSICFSCFDSLERTYRFLQTVRSAQTKLSEIYNPQQEVTKVDEAVAKPVDKDWEAFEESKPHIKDEVVVDVEVPEQQDSEIQVDTALLDCINDIKNEPSNFDDFDDFKSSEDDDTPLLSVLKRKKKKKIKFEAKNVIAEDLTPAIPFPTVSWDEYTWRCGRCDALFQNLESLRLHSLQIHSICCIFKCNECAKNIPNYRLFIKHVREHRKLLRYCCEFCNKRFERSSLLKKHYAAHKHEFQLMCENCGSIFDTAEQLTDHITLYSKGFKRRSDRMASDLKCNICQKEFKTRSNLHQHKLLHTERSRDFSCHKCGKMFFTKGTLSTHMMTHEDIKPYKCEHCSLSFRARGNLQSHLSLHSGAKPFVCEQCGKSFRVKRLLKSHYIVHTDLMPFVCQYCNKTFRFKTRLNLHLRQHTGAKPYTCLYCQRDFTNGSNYKKHMKRRHNIDTSRKKFVEIIEQENVNGDDIILGES